MELIFNGKYIERDEYNLPQWNESWRTLCRHCYKCYCLECPNYWTICKYYLAILCLKKLASGRRNDKLFLLNIIAANLVSLFGSLPGEILGRANIVPSAKLYSIYFNQANFVSFFNNLTSMAALSYTLYENIVKFPGNRLLNFSLSLKIVSASWVLSLVLVLTAQSGFFIARKQDVSICKRMN